MCVVTQSDTGISVFGRVKSSFTKEGLNKLYIHILILNVAFQLLSLCLIASIVKTSGMFLEQTLTLVANNISGVIFAHFFVVLIEGLPHFHSQPPPGERFSPRIHY